MSLLRISLLPHPFSSNIYRLKWMIGPEEDLGFSNSFLAAMAFWGKVHGNCSEKAGHCAWLFLVPRTNGLEGPGRRNAKGPGGPVEKEGVFEIFEPLIFHERIDL
jgi:hypothetical protein